MSEQDARMSSARFGRRIRTWGVAALAAGALALTACQAVPSTGPVKAGLSDLSSTEQQLQFNPERPIEGATQEEIVRGFVKAVSSPSEDYAVAREFLAPGYDTEWDPSHGVFVYEGGQTFSLGGADAGNSDAIGTLMLSGIATVDSRGVMQPLKPGPPTEARFELVQIDGEWRISSAPAGVIIDRQTFLELWLARPVYYLTPDDRLVADSRWLLNRATQTTQIVRELLQGPSELMTLSVRSAFPAGTTLSANSVPVNDGTARIDLSVELLQADEAAMTLIKRQLATSLQAVAGVNRFEIVVDGVVVDSAGVAPDDGVPPDRLNPVVVADGQLVILATGTSEVLTNLSSRVMDLEPTALTMSADQTSVAVLGPGGVHWVSPNDMVQIDVRAGLVEPTIDRFGNVWSYAASAPEQVLITRPGESQSYLAVPWLAGQNPVAVRVSTDGTRLAALVRDGEWSAIVVGSIVRDEAGVPSAVSESAATQMWVSGAPLDLDWVGEQTFAVLSGTSTSGRVTFGTPGLLPTEAGTVNDAVRLGGGGSRTDVRVLSSDGRLYAPQGVGWQRQAEGVSLIAKYG